MNSFFRRGGANKSRNCVSHSIIPNLEPLESRVLPSRYIWTGQGSDNSWQDGNNWKFFIGIGWAGSITKFPGVSASDTAEIGKSTKDIKSNAPVKIATVLVTPGFAKQLTLNYPLTLSKGGAFSGSSTSNIGGSAITISGGEFTWNSGDVNIGTATFWISQGANVNFAIKTNASFAYNISNAGNLDLSNTGSILLRSGAWVTNSRTGFIDISSGGAIKNDNAVMSNSGEIWKWGTEIYSIQNPLENFGWLRIKEGTLSFLGKDPDSGYSVTQKRGYTWLEPDTTLQVVYGYQQRLGELWAMGSGDSTVDGKVDMKGGKITVGSASRWETQLLITKAFLFEGGKAVVFWGPEDTGEIEIAGGTTITKASIAVHPTNAYFVRCRA